MSGLLVTMATRRSLIGSITLVGTARPVMSRSARHGTVSVCSLGKDKGPGTADIIELQ
jgi:hypothetical protein